MASNTGDIKGKKPIIVKPLAKPIVIRKGPLQCNVTKPLYRVTIVKPVVQDVILYKATENSNDYLGEVRKLVIKNCKEISQTHFITKATYFNSNGERIQRTSVNLTKLIGFKNYETVFNIVNSITEEEQRVKALLSLLTVEKISTVKATSTQTDTYSNEKETKDIPIQANIINSPWTMKRHKRIRNPNTPQVFKTSNVVENITNKPDNIVAQNKITPIFNEDSNESNLSASLSVSSEILREAESSILTHTEKTPCEERHNINAQVVNSCDNSMSEVFTNKLFHRIRIWDGTYITVPSKPRDKFHLIDPENMKELTKDERVKLTQHQFLLDWKYCMEPANCGNYLIHLAVMDDDLELLKRQCFALNNRHLTVDIEANGVTALELAIAQHSPAAISLLVDKGASVTRRDALNRNALHMAALEGPAETEALLDAISRNSRRILQEITDKAVPESMSDEQCIQKIFKELYCTHEDQGYSPLMLACRQGAYETATVLLSRSNAAVNHTMPNSGNTALYIAVSVAGETALKISKRAPLEEKHIKTIEILMKNGADPHVANISGSQINSLLQTFENPHLYKLMTRLMTNMTGYEAPMILEKLNGKIIPSKNNVTVSKNAEGKVLQKNYFVGKRCGTSVDVDAKKRKT